MAWLDGVTCGGVESLRAQSHRAQRGSPRSLGGSGSKPSSRPGMFSSSKPLPAAATARSIARPRRTRARTRSSEQGLKKRTRSDIECPKGIGVFSDRFLVGSLSTSDGVTCGVVESLRPQSHRAQRRSLRSLGGAGSKPSSRPGMFSSSKLPPAAATARSIVRPRRARTRARSRSGMSSSSKLLTGGGYGAVVRSAPKNENESEVAPGDVFILETPSGGYGAVDRSAPKNESESEVALGDVFILESPSGGGYGAVDRSAPKNENEGEVAPGDVFILETPSGGSYGAVDRSAPASENEGEVALGDVFILEAPYRRRLRRGRSLGPEERERERGRARGCFHP